MLSITALLIDGKKEQPTVFVIPDMSLSSSRSRMIRRTFLISINASDAAAFLEPIYAEWVVDSRMDDEQCGSPQDELAEAGYPSISQLMEVPQLLDLVVGHYLFQDLVGPLTWDRNSTIKYWFDMVTGCSLNGDTIELKGICYSNY